MYMHLIICQKLKILLHTLLIYYSLICILITGTYLSLSSYGLDFYWHDNILEIGQKNRLQL